MDAWEVCFFPPNVWFSNLIWNTCINSVMKTKTEKSNTGPRWRLRKVCSCKGRLLGSGAKCGQMRSTCGHSGVNAQKTNISHRGQTQPQGDCRDMCSKKKPCWGQWPEMPYENFTPWQKCPFHKFYAVLTHHAGSSSIIQQLHALLGKHDRPLQTFWEVLSWISECSN